MFEVSNSPDASGDSWETSAVGRAHVSAGTRKYHVAQGIQAAVGFSHGSGTVHGFSPLRHETMISTKEERKREDPLSSMATCWCHGFVYILLVFAVSCARLCFCFNNIIAESWILFLYNPGRLKMGVRTIETCSFRCADDCFGIHFCNVSCRRMSESSCAQVRVCSTRLVPLWR